MSEQINTVSNTSKPERSSNYVVSRLSYDCLISATKSFAHNFNTLTDDEKMEFKSLATYVKQLEKCLPSKQNKQVSKPKKVVVESTEQSPVVEEKVVEPVPSKKTKQTKKVEPVKETSPTAVAVAEVSESKAVVEPVKEESKKPVAKKSTQSKTK